jgi:hypothetical protein
VPDVWRRILARVSARSAEIGAFLGHAVPLRVSAEAIEVAFEVGSVFAERATSPDAIALLERAAAAELGTTPRVTIERDSARTQGQPTVATVLVAERDAARERAVTTALEHPAVRDAIAVLGARVRDVHLPDP